MTSEWNRKIKADTKDTILVSDLKVGDLFVKKVYSKIYGGWTTETLIVNKIVKRGVVAEVYWPSYGSQARQGHERLVEHADAEYQILRRL